MPNGPAGLAEPKNSATRRWSWLTIPSATGLAPLSALLVAAEATILLRIGSLVFCNDFRHPALLAREAATLDLLSDGRFEFGLGAGYLPDDYTQLGLAFDTPGTRISRLEEAIQLIVRLWTEEFVTFTRNLLHVHTDAGKAEAASASVPAPVYWGHRQTHPFPCRSVR